MNWTRLLHNNAPCLNCMIVHFFPSNKRRTARALHRNRSWTFHLKKWRSKTCFQPTLAMQFLRICTVLPCWCISESKLGLHERSMELRYDTASYTIHAVWNYTDANLDFWFGTSADALLWCIVLLSCVCSIPPCTVIRSKCSTVSREPIRTHWRCIHSGWCSRLLLH